MSRKCSICSCFKVCWARISSPFLKIENPQREDLEQNDQLSAYLLEEHSQNSKRKCSNTDEFRSYDNDTGIYNDSHSYSKSHIKQSNKEGISFKDKYNGEIELLAAEILSNANNLPNSVDLYFVEQIINSLENNYFSPRHGEIEMQSCSTKADLVQIKENKAKMEQTEGYKFSSPFKIGMAHNEAEKDSTNASKHCLNEEKEKNLANVFSYDPHIEKFLSYRSSQGNFENQEQKTYTHCSPKLLKGSMSSDLIEFPLSQETNNENYYCVNIISNESSKPDCEINTFETPLENVKEVKSFKLYDSDEIQAKIQLLNSLILRITIFEKEISCFENQFEENSQFELFISDIFEKIQRLNEDSDFLLAELQQLNQISLSSPQPYNQAELSQSQCRIISLNTKMLDLENFILECENEFIEFEKEKSKEIINYINEEFDIFIPKYDELGERIISVQEDIDRLLKLFGIMESKVDYQNELKFIHEAITSLQLEQQRINIFEDDIKNVKEICQKAIDWYLNKFNEVTIEEIRKLRRYLGNMEPKVFNKELIYEELNSILEVRERIINIINDLGDANIQAIVHEKSLVIERLNELLDSCENSVKSLDDAIIKIRSDLKMTKSSNKVE